MMPLHVLLLALACARPAAAKAPPLADKVFSRLVFADPGLPERRAAIRRVLRTMIQKSPTAARQAEEFLAAGSSVAVSYSSDNHAAPGVKYGYDGLIDGETTPVSLTLLDQLFSSRKEHLPRIIAHELLGHGTL